MSQFDGTPDADLLTGGDDSDVLNGLAGDDTLKGAAGLDTMIGGDGTDRLEGGDGADVLTGGAGADFLLGEGGYDLIAPGAGDDSIDGGAGLDTLALTGLASDYTLTELVAPTETISGVYRLHDTRAGSPEGTDQVIGVETFRFGSGPEVSLATMLNRAPTAIELSHVAGIGPIVSEIAPVGQVVAQLTALDPDPGDKLTLSFAPGGDAGGRFVLDGDLLRVAKADGFDFEAAPAHEVTVIATDEAGNTFSRTISVGVRDNSDNFSSLNLSLPSTASFGTATLWELAGGGFVVTWMDYTGTPAVYARQIDENGDLVGTGDVLLAQSQDLASSRLRFLGVDDAGVAAFFFQNAGSDYQSESSVTDDVMSYSSRRVEYDEVRWVDASTGQQLGTFVIDDVMEDSGSSEPAGYDETRSIQSSTSTGYESALVSYQDGYLLYEVDTISRSSFSNFLAEGESLSNSYPLIYIDTRRSVGGSFETINTTVYALKFGAAPLTVTTSASHDNDSGSGSSRERIVYYNQFDGERTQNASQSYQESDSDWQYFGAYASNGAPFVFSVNFSRENAVNSTSVNYDITEEQNLVEQTHWEFSGVNGRFSLPVSPDSGLNPQASYFVDASHAALISFDSATQSYWLTIHREGGAPIAHEISGGNVASIWVDGVGANGYMLTYGLYAGDGSYKSVAQIFSLTGQPVTEPLVYDGYHRFLARDDGTVVAYGMTVAPDGSVTLGASGLVKDILVTTRGGNLADSDGDGDLDFAGTLTLGTLGGTAEILRLEGGTYELTASTLKVTGATVYAEIGNNTFDPLFKGSFDLDRASGLASNFVTTALPGGTEVLKLGGLDVTYKGLLLKKDAAAFTASFAIPDGLFGLGDIDLSGPNALEISANGPEIGGFEITIPSGTYGGAGGAPDSWFSLNLFEAKAKDIKIRYDAALDEFSIGGELEVTSDIIDGLASFGGLGDVTLKFTDFKIKDGLYDFAGEFSAKSWNVGLFKLKDVKLGVKIDDNVIQQVDVQAGVSLPFKALNGLSFSGQLLNPPLTLNAIAVTAETTIPLPQGFFLDSISASLTNLAGSPPEPTPLPTTLSGTLGIGWGPKIPSFTPPEFTGLDEIKDARLVNIKLTASTDFTSMISGTGSINLYKDELVKQTGTITWDWQKDTVTIAGEVVYFNGIARGTQLLRVSEIGFTASGSVSLALPYHKALGPLGGLVLGSANVFTQYLQDADLKNDLHAVWGTVNIPVIGSMTVGYKVDFNTFLQTPILGANDLPKTNSFDVGGTEDWLMISAVWDNDAAGEVATRVRTPEGTFIQEADYAANGITVIDLFTGSRSKTIVIDNPRAGNWDLQVIDPSLLGTVAYKGYSPNAPVSVTVTAASAGADAAMGEATAQLAGVDPGTRVTFWADSDTTGLDGFALGSATVDADGSVTIEFPTSLLSGGTWFVYAVADDGMNAPASHYLATPITVAHRPTGVTIEPYAPPLADTAEARIGETALPGVVVGELAVETGDLAETHVFTLVDDAGGRFAIDGTRLVVAAGAPLDGRAGAYSVTVRATSSAGLSVDQVIDIEVAAGDPGQIVRPGLTTAREVIVGNEGRDAFFQLSAGDTVSGGAGEDVLFLSGNRDDFEVIVDPTGAITGPVYLLVVPDSYTGPPPATAFDPPAPYLVIRDLRTPEAAPIIASGIEAIQFADQRIAPGGGANTAPVAVADSFNATEDQPLVITAAQGVLANDDDEDGNALSAVLVSGPAHGVLALNGDGSFTYTPDADYAGEDGFTYKASDGTADSEAVAVSITVAPVADAPRITSAGAVSMAENQTVLPAVTAQDADGDTPSFAITGGADAARFVIDSVSGALSFVAAPNFEAPGDADADNVYHVLVSASDGVLAGTQAIAVTITDAADTSSYVGTPGNDTARNTSGLDWHASGLGGGDTLTGGAGVDSIFGGDGADRIDGRAGKDLVDGGADDDTLLGGADNDTLSGGAGADDLDGGTGADVLSGGAGDDVFAARSNSGADTIDGGEGGADRIVARSANAFANWATTSAVEIFDGAGQANFRVLGSADADAIDLAGVALINGALVDGGLGNDTITGNGDANTIAGGAGDDSVSAGDGDDTILVQSGGGADTIDGGAGAADRIAARGAKAVVNWTTTSNVEIFDGAGFAGFRIVGSANGDAMDLSAVQLIGVAAIEGGAGDDTITGNDDANTISGGIGDDSLSGGGGDDTFLLQSLGGRDAIDGGAGVDTILATRANLALDWTRVGAVEVVDAGGFANVRITGTEGDDALHFTAVELRCIARIEGGAGNDAITGSAAGDTISGGAGADTLAGGAGDDRFTWRYASESAAAAPDHILDFAAGDTIDLSTMDASTRASGVQAFRWIGAAAFSRSAGELRAFDDGLGHTVIQGDTNGDGAADLEIRLANAYPVTAGDFIGLAL